MLGREGPGLASPSGSGASAALAEVSPPRPWFGTQQGEGCVLPTSSPVGVSANIPTRQLGPAREQCTPLWCACEKTRSVPGATPPEVWPTPGTGCSLDAAMLTTWSETANAS
ncbi:unnamed protein product [Lampetra planeri]